MIIVILALLGAIIGAIVGRRKDTSDSIVCWGLSGAMIGFVIIAFVSISVCENTKLPRRVVSTKYIYSLQDNTLTPGRFFLGGGSVNERPVYSYYEKGNYGYRLGYTYADEVEIIESNSVPRVEKSRPIIIRKKPFYKSMIWIIAPPSCDRTTIYIPVGTIIKNFNLDSKY